MSSTSSPAPARTDAAALQHARRVATAIAVEAGDLAMSWYHRGVATEEKGHADLVSEADRQVEALVKRRLVEAFPEDAVVGEEGTGPTSVPTEGARRWYVDPIDGTTNFLKGLPDWGVSIGLAGPADELLVGVIVMPRHGTLFSAARGLGATRNGVPIHASTVDRVDRTLMCYALTARAPEAWGGPDRMRAGYLALVGNALGTRMQGCSVADLTSVATGVIDASWAGGMSPWDVAAGLTIVLEAGARVTDVEGNPVSTVTTDFLASPPAVHDELRALIAGG